MTDLPLPALVVLIGPSGSGKSTWAAGRYAGGEIVSSDQLRSVVGTGAGDLDASDDAFAVLDAVLTARLRRRLTTVVDTLGLDAGRRAGWVARARDAGLPVVAVCFGTEPAICRRRNASRDRPVPARALAEQVSRMAGLDLSDDGFDLVVTAAEDDDVESAHTPGTAAAGRAQRSEPTALRFGLQLSAFPWGEDPRTWLSDLARTAEAVGFSDLAVMDHLLQIPQVGRAWDPLPEAYVTLGHLSGSTDRIRLGALVSPMTFRAAPLLAKMLATLDVVSGGRAFCGIGAGWYEREHEAYDLAFPPTTDRLDLLEAAIGVLRAFWGAGTKPYGGLPETTSYPRPLQGQIPITLGGNGTRRTLDIAARLGDACNVRGSLPEIDRMLESLRWHLRRARRDPGEVQITVLDIPIIGTSPDHVAALVERHRGRMSAADYSRAREAGTIEQHLGRYRLLADRGVGTVFVALPDLSGPAELERFAPIIEAFRRG